MEDHSSEPRDLLEKIEALMVRHADEWIRILQAWWSVSGNPLFQLMALRLFLDSRRPEAVLPPWLRSYVFMVSDNVVAGAFGLDPREMPKLLGRATGLVLPRRKVVADALKLWEAPAFIAVYDDLCRQASVSARAEWALRRLRSIFGLQSTTAARECLTAARAAVRSVLGKLGRPDDDEAISASCAEWLPVWAAMTLLRETAGIPATTIEGLAASYSVKPSGAAILGALAKQLSRQQPQASS